MRQLKTMRAATYSIFAAAISLSMLMVETSPAQTQPITTDTSDSQKLSLAACLRTLDRTVQHISAVDSDTAQQRLATLAQSCESVPQVHHNLGVLAARRGEWELAITAFERAIALSPNTADTVSQLKAVHEYQAKLAWQLALELKEPVEAPTFKLQSSLNQNPNLMIENSTRDGVRSVATMDYELYSWWHALTPGSDQSAWLAHYSTDYPPSTLDTQRPVPWKEVSRHIQFTAQDAAVVLSWEVAGKTHYRMLLLTLTGERWRIYHESAL